MFQISKQILAKKIFLIICYLCAYSLLIYGYKVAIIENFASLGFQWYPNKMKICEGVIFSILIPCILPYHVKKPSDIILHLHFLLPILPMLVLYGSADYSRTYVYQTLVAFLLIVVVVSIFRSNRIKAIKISSRGLQKILLFLSLLVLISIVLFGGLNYFNLDFSLVYLLRDDAASNLPNIFGYLSPLTSKVLLPTSLLLAVINKNKLYAMISIIGSVMIFGLTAHKGPLLYPVIILGIYYLTKNNNVLILIICSYMMLIIVSIIGLWIGDLGTWIGSIILRRAYFTPGVLNFYYYDFFSSHLFTWWSESKISLGLVHYPYGIESSNIIGREYYGNVFSNANTGWIGSGYMNAGFLGMLLYAGIIGITLSIINIYSKIISTQVALSMVIIPFFAMMLSSDLPVAMLNHGIILSILLCSLIKVQYFKPIK